MDIMKNINTIEKYLRLYGDKTTQEIAINEADYLYFSILAYIHVNEFKNSISYFEFAKKAVTEAPKEKYGKVVTETTKILENNMSKRRYQDVRVEHYTYIIDENTQFGAMVFVFDGKAIVSFTGSDGTLVGWYENIRVGYKYPTYTQNMASKYLADIIDEYDNITILGHSKGGNLAIAAVLELNRDKLYKIDQILNFDGPGFPKRIYESEVYNEIENKITNYTPDSSYIGVLLYQGGKTKIIKTNTKGIDVHFQFNWLLFGSILEEADEYSERSKKIHYLSTERFQHLDRDEIESIMENAFNEITMERKNKIKIGFKDIVNGIKYNHKNDVITYREIKDILYALIIE